MVFVYRWLTDLADVLRDAGLTVVEIDGWKTRGRPSSTGQFNPVGVLWHHTGTLQGGKEYAEWLAKVGRSDLPAPLVQTSVGRDGTWYICAAGRANHAGTAKPSGSVAGGDGNSLYVGVECQNNGAEGWSKAQYDSMVTGGAALGAFLHCTTAAQRAHKETSVTGKWDPGLLQMDKFRADIGAAMEDDMLNDADRQFIKDTVHAAAVRENERDKRRYQRVVARLSELAAEVADDATKGQIRALRDEILAEDVG